MILHPKLFPLLFSNLMSLNLRIETIEPGMQDLSDKIFCSVKLKDFGKINNILDLLVH